MHLLYRGLGGILSAMNFAASALIAGLMLLIGADVLGRTLLGIPVHGVPELTKLGIVTIVWLQMGHTLHLRKHLRADTFLERMSLPARRVIEASNYILGAFLFALIAYSSSQDLMQTWTDGTFEGEHPLRIPLWPVWLVLMVGAALTALEFVVQAAQATGLLKIDEPVTAPIQEI